MEVGELDQPVEMPAARVAQRADPEMRPPESYGLGQLALRRRDRRQRLVRIHELQRIPGRRTDRRLRPTPGFLPVVLRRRILNLHVQEHRVAGESPSDEVQRPAGLAELRLQQLRALNAEIKVRDRRVHRGGADEETLGNGELVSIAIDEREVVEDAVVVGITLQGAVVRRLRRLEVTDTVRVARDRERSLEKREPPLVRDGTTQRGLRPPGLAEAAVDLA